MFISIRSGLILLIIGSVVSSMSQIYYQRAGQSFRGNSSSHRMKRAIASTVGSILKSAKLLSEKNGLKVYRKTGGKEQAINDFQELRPSKTRGYRHNFWHFATVGDRKALLRYEDTSVTLSIWKYEQLSNGRRKRVMDKILY